MSDEEVMELFKEFRKSCSESEQDQPERSGGVTQELVQEPCPVCGGDPQVMEFCVRCHPIMQGNGLVKETGESLLDSPAGSPPPSTRSATVPQFTIPALAGDHTPAVELQREATHHRAILYLASQGMNNKEIAAALGITPPVVAYTKKQPWAQQFINEMQDQFGRKQVLQVLQEAAVSAARTIAETAKIDGKIMARPEAKIKAAEQLLSRLFGSAQQTVRHVQVDANELTDDELAAIAKNQEN